MSGPSIGSTGASFKLGSSDVSLYLGADKVWPTGKLGTPTYFPMRNTATDPTYFFWRSDNAGYTFVPNDGIYTASVMTNASFMLSDVSFDDPDIALWDTSQITSMNNMFSNNPTINRDLSGWCVSNIPTKPAGFDNGATAWVLPRPIWGTCP